MLFVIIKKSIIKAKDTFYLVLS